jgi:hypothetical protein
MNCDVCYSGNQVSFDETLMATLNPQENLLYEIIYSNKHSEFSVLSPNRKDEHTLGKNLLSFIGELKHVVGEITIRGPIIIVGEDQ